MKRLIACVVLVCLVLTLFHSAVEARAVEANLAQADSAYEILEELANKKRNERYFNATMSALGGLGTGVLLGLIFGAVDEQAGFYGFIIPSAIGLAYAGFHYAFPSEAERELSAVEDLSGSDREAQSAEALMSLSERAYVARMIRVGLLAVSAVSGLLFDDEDSLESRLSGAVASVAAAAFTYFVPSDEERAYQKYLRLSQA